MTCCKNKKQLHTWYSSQSERVTKSEHGVRKEQKEREQEVVTGMNKDEGENKNS